MRGAGYIGKWKIEGDLYLIKGWGEFCQLHIRDPFISAMQIVRNLFLGTREMGKDILIDDFVKNREYGKCTYSQFLIGLH